MTPVRRRALVLAAAMVSTAVAAAWLKPGAGSGLSRLNLDGVFPSRFGDWQVDPESAAFVRAADRRGAQVRLYDQVLERTFVNSAGDRIMLSVAYGVDQSADLQLHRPEVCYRAGGFEVGPVSGARLSLGGTSLPVTRLVASMPGRPEPITYWAVVGGRFDDGRSATLTERLSLVAQRRRGDGLLVRVSSIDQDADAAWKLQGEFTQALLQALAPADRARVVGAVDHP
jgi:EpsI family protein